MKKAKKKIPKQIYFLCAMPRSGNTLFASLMNQNPELVVTPNSITLSIMTALYFLKDSLVFQNWPDVDQKMLENQTINFVIQINGKKKEIIKVKKDIDEKTIMELIKKDDKLIKSFNNKKINKVFFVKNRLINILLE